MIKHKNKQGRVLCGRRWLALLLALTVSLCACSAVSVLPEGGDGGDSGYTDGEYGTDGATDGDVQSESGTEAGEDDSGGAEDAQEPPQFRTEDALSEHYQKHVIDQNEFEEFGDISKEEYLQMAQLLLTSPGQAVSVKTEEDGDQLFYDYDANFFAVISADGYIRTFFRPSAGADYFERQ